MSCEDAPEYTLERSASRRMSENIITVAGSSYFQPISDLVERLLQRERRKVVAGRVGYPENGYALSIVLLLVVALESYVGRVSYLQREEPKVGKKKGTSVPDYIASLRKSFGMQKSLTEVFVLRDVIAHSHVWELTVSDHAVHGQVLRAAALLPGYGDYKYKVVINPRTRRSSVLGLNLVPSAVGIREVHKVFTVVWRTLEFLAKSRLLERAAFAHYGRFRGKPFEFWELRHVLKEAL